MDKPTNETLSTAQASAGRDRCQLEASRNPITGQVVVQAPEERLAYDRFTTAIIDSFEPKTPIEQQLAQSYASAQWRINRAAAMEETLFSLGLGESTEVHNAIGYAKTFRDQTLAFDKLSIYSQRLVNQSDKILQQLVHLQTHRKRREESELSEASVIYKLHRMQGLNFDPQANGFAVTIDQIRASIRRSVLKTEAFQAEKLDWNGRAYEKKYGQAAA